MIRTAKAVCALAGCLFAIPAFARLYTYDPTLAENGRTATSAMRGTAASVWISRNMSDAYLLNLYGRKSAWLLDPYWLPQNDTTAEMISLGYAWRNIRLEGALLREQQRDDRLIHIGAPKLFGITSSRLAYRPDANWTFQITRGQLTGAELLDPRNEVKRTTLSVVHHHAFDRNEWQTLLAAGRSGKRDDGSSADTAYLLESSLRFKTADVVFGRLERAAGEELFNDRTALYGQRFNATRASLGYVHDFVASGAVRLGIGALVSKRFIPDREAAVLGVDPASYKVFVRVQMQYP
ncbi:MAG TPA: hypothetical protein VJ577_02635 [Burkholderiaceae bacterium]|nr:hypothetical protein [Burkholderiaceae bacterium]